MDSSKSSEANDSVRNYADLTGQIQLLGEEPVFDGNYSKVFKGQLNGKSVAVKVLKYVPGKNDAAMERKMKREMNFWSKSKSVYIAIFLGHATGPKLGPLGALVSPWYMNGDSHTYLEARKDTLTFWDRIDLLASTALGILYLHRHGMVHGDIKPGNVLIAKDGRPKICDFGLARVFLDATSGGPTTTSEFTGTPRYLAPDLLTSESTPPTTASDVWAFGCLGLEYMFGVTPYAWRLNNNRGMIYQDIKGGRLPCEKMVDKRGLDDAVLGLLHLCWHHDHTRRPQMADVASLAKILRGEKDSRLWAFTDHSWLDVRAMALLIRHVDNTPSNGVPLFVRPSPRFLLQDNTGFTSQRNWRQWALFQVLDFGIPEGKIWKVREMNTGIEDILLNPEEAHIVTTASVSREYEESRSLGENPFPILPVGKWPIHGKGPVLQVGWAGF